MCRPHPYSLVGSDCDQGVCRTEFSNETMTKTFSNLGIQCELKANFNEALKQRAAIGVDPFDSE